MDESGNLVIEEFNGSNRQKWFVSFNKAALREYVIKNASVMNDKDGAYYLNLDGTEAPDISHEKCIINLMVNHADWLPFGIIYSYYEALLNGELTDLDATVINLVVRGVNNYKHNIQYKTRRLLKNQEENENYDPFDSDRFIKGQNFFEALKIGDTNVKIAGYGSIGPYNALRARELSRKGLNMTASVKTVDYYKILAEFDTQNFLVKSGNLGLIPWGEKDFLDSRNIGYDVLYDGNLSDTAFRDKIDEVSQDGDIFIYTYWNTPNPPTNGAHTVAITKGLGTEKSICVHQFYGNDDLDCDSWAVFLPKSALTITCYRLH